MSDKNRAAQKRYRDKQRDKVESYKRQVEELTQQVQRLLEEKADHASSAASQGASQSASRWEEPGSRALCSGSHATPAYSRAEPDDLSNEAALCQTLIDMGHTLASQLPEAQPLASLLKGQEHDFKGASQALAQIWQAYAEEMAHTLMRGGADSSSPHHVQLIKLCGAMQEAKRRAYEKHPLVTRWLQLRLRPASPAYDYSSILDSLQLTAPQLGGVLRAQQALKAGLGAIAEQRRQMVQPLLLAPVADGSEARLADYHLAHHRACQFSKELFVKENACFMTFIDAMYQALGPVAIARLYAETSYCDFLTLAEAIDKAVTSPSATLSGHQAQQQPPWQLSQQLPLQIHPLTTFSKQQLLQETAEQLPPQLPLQVHPLTTLSKQHMRQQTAEQLPLDIHPLTTLSKQQMRQESTYQLPQQLPLDIHPSVYNFVEAMPEFGTLDPAQSNQLLGCLDFLQDVSIAPGQGS